MNLNEKILYAERLINNKNVGVFDRLYPFSTENLTYMSDFNFSEKNFLTVGSSCDQIFNAHLLDARKIVCFDINPLTDIFYSLKSSAIRVLDYKDFLSFFSYHHSFFRRNKSVFDNDIFNYIYSNSKDENLFFWKYFFDRYPSILLRKKLFSNDEYYTKILVNSNSYLCLSGYNELKSKIDSLSPIFINSDFRDISHELNDKFDYINLSNIAAFIEKMYDDPLTNFKDDVLELLNFLNDEGCLFLAYLYDMSFSTNYVYGWDVIYNLKEVYRLFGRNHLSYIEFKSISDSCKNRNNSNDMVLVYKK